jgi:uncharacterized delta-60 repeat protein
LVVLGVLTAPGLTVACFHSAPAPQHTECTEDLGALVLPCRDATAPGDGGAVRDLPDGTLPGDSENEVAEAAVADAGSGDATVFVAPPLPTCAGTFGLDPAFGTMGLVIDPRIVDGPLALAVQADGDALVSGDAILGRYGANGSIDTSFGQGGYVTFADQTSVETLLPQPNGDIVIGGVGGVDQSCLIERLTPSGSVDTTFGVGGRGDCTNFRTMYPAAFNQVAQRPNGSFVAEGAAYPLSTDRDFTLVQYDANGNADSTFGTDGEAVAGFTVDAPVGPFILQPDGKALVTGEATVDRGDMPAQLAVARFNVNGSLDTSFGTGGRATFTLPQADVGPVAVAVQSTGAIVIATQGAGLSESFSVVRLTPTGQLDSTFGTAGIATGPFSGLADSIVALNVLADDSMLVGGQYLIPDDAGYGLLELAFVHFLASGAVDTSFGTGGAYFTPVPGEDQGTTYGFQAFQSNGGLLVAAGGGHLDDAGDSVIIDGVLARYACH